MKIKTSELKDAFLDWAVGYIMGEKLRILDRQIVWPEDYTPSTDWAQGGPIIERETLGVWWATHFVDGEGVEYGNHWYCETGCTDENVNETYHNATGPTPLIAAMRCYVASKLGDEVDVPEELQ
jgi:hypothetical protein